MDENAKKNMDIAVYNRIADPMAAMNTLGIAIAKSHMFGCENEDQGRVLAMACICEGLNPLALTRRYMLPT